MGLYRVMCGLFLRFYHFIGLYMVIWDYLELDWGDVGEIGVIWGLFRVIWGIWGLYREK